MDVTPIIPGNRSVIDSYGPNRFRISGNVHQGSMIVFPLEIMSWALASIDDVTADDILDVVGRPADPVEILLLGCGARMAFVQRSIREAALGQGVMVEVMDTGAACRTYNVLMAEGRRVGAALIAI